MFRPVPALFALALTVAPALAADRPLNNAAIANLVSGKQFMLNGGIATFGKDRSYNFAGLFGGQWRATNRSLCITFATGEKRCDRVVKNGKSIYLIDATGQRSLLK